MNIDDAFELFEKLGVVSVIENNVVKFYDSESGSQMEIDGEKKKKELSISDLNSFSAYISYTLILDSPKKVLSFCLIHPNINGYRAEKQVILRDIDMYCENFGDFRIVELNKSFDTMRLMFKKNHYLDSDVLDLKGNNCIDFNIEGKFGRYYNGYNEKFNLNELEMRKILDSSNFVQICAEYYGKMYPEILETLKNAKSFVKGKSKRKNR